jgi:hypothetical protein
MPFNNLAYASERREDRDEVHHRTRAVTAGGASLPVTVVNISPNGLMARCEAAVEPGTRLGFFLPGLQPLNAEVRWVLGGRIGCEFERSIPPAAYYALLARIAA